MEVIRKGYCFLGPHIMLLFSCWVMSNSFVTLWTVACQAPLSLGFPIQENWSGLPFPSPGDLPNSGIEPMSPVLAGGLFTTEPPGKLPNLIIFSACLISLKHLTALTIDYPLGPGNFSSLSFIHLPSDLPFPMYYVIKCSHQNLNLSVKFRILLCASEKIEYRKQLYSVFGKQPAQDWLFRDEKRMGGNLYTVRRDDAKSQPWRWERWKVGGEGEDRGWDGWMASPTWWTWVWVDSGNWEWTGKPGMLQSMGTHRIGHVTSVEEKQRR